ncbi:hypothetical protein HO173_011557 [Letharia columbiana]|uniref:Uncharacterized protein n=1 Tax=Letharia columbiana TaxID=112416 RepID=A0A8H6KZ49_9LECA|nr:uncharacterized protein HO173_011557 [Letharia columbiana]KAF6229517.1 hypothetical protein HO173_011557 [Letharia columbiana]
MVTDCKKKVRPVALSTVQTPTRLKPAPKTSASPCKLHASKDPNASINIDPFNSDIYPKSPPSPGNIFLPTPRFAAEILSACTTTPHTPKISRPTISPGHPSPPHPSHRPSQRSNSHNPYHRAQNTQTQPPGRSGTNK